MQKSQIDNPLELKKKDSQPDFQYTLKLIIIGDSGVGKSSIMLRYNQNKFVQNYMMTIGINYVGKTVQIDNKKIRLQIWDTAGQQKYRTITKNYYRHSHGAIIAFSIDSRDSFNSIARWIDQLFDEVNSKIEVILVGTKNDLEDEREVSYQQATQYAKNYSISYLQCSAKSGDSVNQVFMQIGRMMKKRVIDSVQTQPIKQQKRITLIQKTIPNSCCLRGNS